MSGCRGCDLQKVDAQTASIWRTQIDIERARPLGTPALLVGVLGSVASQSRCCQEIPK